MTSLQNKQRKLLSLPGLPDFCSAIPYRERQIIRYLSDMCDKLSFNYIRTRSIDYRSNLGSLDDNPDSVFHVLDQRSKEDLALRFDLTHPLMRLFNQSSTSSLFEHRGPYKLYQHGLVWRNEKSDTGRFREFVQFDADILNTAHMTSDIEVLTMFSFWFSFFSSPFRPITVAVNSREIMESFFVAQGLDIVLQKDILRTLDKYDRIGPDGVLSLLKDSYRKDQSGDVTKGLSLSESVSRNIISFLEIGRSLIVRNTNDIKSFLREHKICPEIINRFTLIIHLTLIRIEQIEHEDFSLSFDPSVVRGLDYYSGIIFESYMQKRKMRISLGGGGRYVYTTEDGKKSAVGCSVGVTRLAHFFSQSNDGFDQTPISFFIARLDDSLLERYYTFLFLLEDQDFVPCIFCGDGSLKLQMKYADKNQYDFVILYGKKEEEEECFILRNMRKGKEEQKNIRDKAGWTKSELLQKKIKIADMYRIRRYITDWQYES